MRSSPKQNCAPALWGAERFRKATRHPCLWSLLWGEVVLSPPHAQRHPAWVPCKGAKNAGQQGPAGETSQPLTMEEKAGSRESGPWPKGSRIPAGRGSVAPGVTLRQSSSSQRQWWLTGRQDRGRRHGTAGLMGIPCPRGGTRRWPETPQPMSTSLPAESD